MKKTIVWMLAGLLLPLWLHAQVNIIPKPLMAEKNGNTFVIDTKTKILYPRKNAELQRQAEILSQTVEKLTGVALKTATFSKLPAKNAIVLNTNAAIATDNADTYTLEVAPQFILLEGSTAKAVFYGLQTLQQLLPQEKGTFAVEGVSITDYPRFEWRGMLLDVCRYMFSMDHIKRTIDEMAYYKLNKLHWHLTEDQGWRIEIKKYPKLQEIAAYRNGTQYGPNRANDVDDVRYGGYYTQEQIKEIVAYAAERYIEVIPEIEMPGHSVAAITAYNHLACNEVSIETGKPFEVRQRWGVSKDLLCAGKEEVFTFLEDVLMEVMDLFPSEYIHVGGDEAPHDAWKTCPHCQQRIKAEGLKDEAELQSYFIRRMEKFINSKGKKLIGWEEIMQGGLTPNATVMSWLGTQSGVKAAKMGHQVIMCPYSHMYMDAYNGSPDIEPLAIGYNTPFPKMYSFEPVHPSLTKEEERFILGVQGNLWAEFISNEDVFQYMLYPRICALSEIAWSPKEAKNWNDFQGRLSHEMLRFLREDINYRIPTPEAPTSVFLHPGQTLTINNSWGLGEIRYTTDGTEPTANSTLYTGPFAPKLKTIVRSAVFMPNGKRSNIWNTIIREKSPRENFVK
ncbi:family 20 glycosylhydrolase [Parabacteroides sp. OttesenSCG-928-G06]|nr:family 20 glycosylhydrolase [Parabacteroides sp. OttesenSCG-928-G06]